MKATRLWISIAAVALAACSAKEQAAAPTAAAPAPAQAASAAAAIDAGDVAPKGDSAVSRASKEAGPAAATQGGTR